jgi:hypothetical protein
MKSPFKLNLMELVQVFGNPVQGNIRTVDLWNFIRICRKTQKLIYDLM